MKRILLLGLLVIVGCGGHSSFNPPPTTSSTTISITCPTGQTCNGYTVYRIIGSCPSVLDNSSGWSILGSTTNSSFVDSNVSAGNVYSYDVETLNGTRNSGPSNCITRTL